MPNAKISLPDRLSLDDTFNLAKELDYYSQHDRLIINLPQKLFFAPFVMLFIGMKIRSFKTKCPDVTVIFNGWEHHSYLSNMGFFDLCGFEHGKHLGEASGSENYIPITEIHRKDFIESKMDEIEEFQDLIQRKVDRISKVVARDSLQNKDLFDVLSYCLREIFRNVFEHGETDTVFYSAQYWPTSNRVEVAIGDYGIGVRKGLGTNPNFRFSTDKQALEYALLPSVSGKTHLPRRSETWFNSGYGLYMTNRLARNGGSFVIASGDSAVYFSQKTKNNFNTSFPGTVLRLSLNVSKIGAVQARLSEFRQDGQKIAATISGSGNRPPSAMSLLLRRDFQT